ncbi:MAG: 3-phosphoshikimate 1-carboxyvinyltransferase [Muribaculaceae bacterium]|nr:3-phosphoshikimate 1-carboxyvinyltransferase [Muribaculaceae bacterium]
MDYRIFPPEEILETSVTLPPSKSIAARRLILNYIAGQKPSAADDACGDTAVLASALASGLPSDGSDIDVGAAGTAMRFLTALCAATDGCSCVLSGSERMCERPIGPLVDVLRVLGADITYLGDEGFPPLRINGRRLAGGSVEIDASVSSQYVSALMMVVPLLGDDLTVRLLGEARSMPYIRMTAALMERHGATVGLDRDKVEIARAPLKVCDYAEPDWSAAAFWYEIAAVTAGWVTLEGLSDDTVQGDREAAKLFERLGVLTESSAEGAELSATPDLYNSLDADLADMPDAVPALVVTCCLTGIPFRLSGIDALRHKESDRIAALCAEMAKIGCLLETEAYGTVLSWDGRRVPVRSLPEFDPYGDHRMAMALAPVSVFVPGIVVRDAEVVAKSYPSYWQQLVDAGFRLADPSDPIPAIEEQ